MIDIEKQIENYIEDFYSLEDLQILTSYINIEKIQDDVSVNDPQYINICNNILNLLNNSNLLNKYRIEIDCHCRFLIKKLFDTYVDKDTFLVTSDCDHESVTSLLGDNEKYIVNIFNTSRKPDEEINNIIHSFKKSKCNKIFCIMISTASQATITVNQLFYKKLKEALLKENIKHLMVLDDCQSIFIIEKNYEIFDAFLATAHVLSPLFADLGLLFTKLPLKIGFTNKQILTDFYYKLNIIQKHKDKAVQFNSLLKNYFNDTLLKTNFNLFDYEAPHQFAISLPNTINNKKFDEQFIRYNIRFNPVNSPINFIRLRYHEFIIQDPKNLIKALDLVKTFLNKMARYKELSSNKINYNYTSRSIEKKDIFLHPKIEALISIDQARLIQKRFFLNLSSRIM